MRPGGSCRGSGSTGPRDRAAPGRSPTRSARSRPATPPSTGPSSPSRPSAPACGHASRPPRCAWSARPGTAAVRVPASPWVAPPVELRRLLPPAGCHRCALLLPRLKVEHKLPGAHPNDGLFVARVGLHMRSGSVPEEGRWTTLRGYLAAVLLSLAFVVLRNAMEPLLPGQAPFLVLSA